MSELKRIEAIEKELQEIKNIIVKKKISGWIKPEMNQSYFYLDSVNEITMAKWSDDIYDEYRFNSRNCFLSKDGQILNQQKKNNAETKLKILELEHAEKYGWPDWDDEGQVKISLYQWRKNKIGSDYTHNTNEQGQCYFAQSKINILSWVEEHMEDLLEYLFMDIRSNE